MGQFLRSWLFVLLALSAGIVALNIAIDPFGILGMPRLAGFNADKIAAADWPRLTKPYMVEAANPATLVLGVSNVDVGIDPASPAWPEADRPVFNLAVDGASGPVLVRFLQHALVRTQPKRVLIGVSFEDAFVMPQAPGPANAGAMDPQWGFESRMRLGADGRPNPDYPEGRLKDLVFATFSFDALKDSLLTLLRQSDPENTHQTRLGFNSGGKFVRWTREEGWNSLIMDKDRELAPRFLSFAEHPVVAVQPVIDVIRLARAHGAQPIVFIMPGHVDKLELFQQTGLTEQMFAWQAALADAIEREPGDAVPLWDFSSVSPYVTEPLPPAGDTRTAMRWTWEPIHFRAALGDLMIARMLTEHGPADLGARIQARDLPARNALYRQAMAQWEETHPADVARLAAVVSSNRKQSFLAKKDQKTLIR